MQENREFFPNLPESKCQHLLRGGSNHHPVPVLWVQIQEFVTNTATDQVLLKPGIRIARHYNFRIIRHNSRENPDYPDIL